MDECRFDAVGVEELVTDGPTRVALTPAAADLLRTVVGRHGPVMFHQSGGCCDGSAPMCYAQGDFLVGDADQRLGEIGGCPFYMSKSQFEYWRHTQLVIDVVPGRGGMFSLDNGEGVRFLTRSRVFSDEESAALRAAEGGGPTLLRGG